MEVSGKAQFMRRGAHRLAAIFLILFMVFAFEAYAEQIRIGIIGDQTWSRDLAASYRIMEQGISLLMDQNPDIIVHTGDIVESAAGEAEMERGFKRASDLLGKTRVPWCLAAGDHDVNPPEYYPDSRDRSREAFFLSLLRQRVPFVRNLYYSFDRGPFHFIILYSGEHLHTDPRWGNVFLSRLSDRQYGWLRQDLEANKEKEAVIVFVHQPLWYNWSGWSRVHRLLRAYPVAAVVAGHFHYNQDEGTLDGIRYVVVGATSGETKRGGPGAGAVHHVTLMTVNSERKVHLHPIAVSSPGEMSFGVRSDMDRVQALASAVTEFEGSRAVAGLYLKEGNRLVDDCSGDRPARLKLGPFGNALDIPLSITVGFRSTSPSITLASSAYDKEACTSVEGATCLMRPSYGISIANTSLVVPDKATKPLWEGVLGLAGEIDTTKGHTAGLDVVLSFEGESGKALRLSSKTSDIPINVCPKEGPSRKTDAGNNQKEGGDR